MIRVWNKRAYKGLARETQETAENTPALPTISEDALVAADKQAL